MNVYCECGKELEVMGDESGRVDVAPHFCERSAELAAMKDDLQKTILAIGLHKEAEAVLMGRVEGAETTIADLRHQLIHYEVGAEMQIEEEKGGDHA